MVQRLAAGLPAGQDRPGPFPRDRIRNAGRADAASRAAARLRRQPARAGRRADGQRRGSTSRPRRNSSASSPTAPPRRQSGAAMAMSSAQIHVSTRGPAHFASSVRHNRFSCGQSPTRQYRTVAGDTWQQGGTVPLLPFSRIDLICAFRRCKIRPMLVATPTPRVRKACAGRMLPARRAAAGAAEVATPTARFCREVIDVVAPGGWPGRQNRIPVLF